MRAFANVQSQRKKKPSQILTYMSNLPDGIYYLKVVYSGPNSKVEINKVIKAG